MRRFLFLLAFVIVGCAETSPPAAVLEPPVLVRVTTSYPGADAREMDETVAAPLLQQIDGVENAERLESESRDDGTCTITVRFAPGADIHIVRQLVQNRVSLATPQLPHGVQVKGVDVRIDSGPTDSAYFALYSPDGKLDALTLSRYAYLTVRPELLRIPGVRNLSILGSSRFTLRIHLDAERLAERGLTAEDVFHQIQEKNLAEPAVGPPLALDPSFTITKSGDDLITITKSENGNSVTPEPEKLQTTILKAGTNGRPVLLQDVAKLERGVERDPFALYNGKPALVLHVTRDPGSAPDAFQKTLDALSKAMPPGLAIDPCRANFTQVTVRLPDSSSQERTLEVCKRAEERLRECSGFRFALAFGNERNTNEATILAGFKKNGDADDIRRVLGAIPEVVFRVSDSASPFPVRVTLSGPEMTKLREWADAVTQRVSKDKLGTDVEALGGRDVPRLLFRVDRAKLAELNVAMEDVLNVSNTMPRDAFPRDLLKQKVRSRDGKLVPLSTVASLETGMGPSVVYRVGKEPAVILSGNPPREMKPDAATKSIAEAADEERLKLSLPKAYRVVP